MGRRVRCKLCGDIIESRHVHDFVRCRCGAVAVDGGDDYTKLIANPDVWEFIDDGPVPKKGKDMMPNSKSEY